MKKIKFLLIITILSVAFTNIAIINPITSYPAQAQKGKVIFTKIKQVGKKLCELGGCWYIVEEVIEYFTQDNQENNSVCNNAPGKGCTIRTGAGNPIKIGERRRVISKNRIR
jgi:hypothetical protein